MVGPRFSNFPDYNSDANSPPQALTFLAPLLARAVDVVLQLDAHLPLVGLVSDVRVLQELLGGGALGVVLHQAALDEAEELLGPGGGRGREGGNGKRYGEGRRRDEE